MRLVVDVTCSQPYQVVIGTKLLEEAGSLIREACGGARAVVVTDSNVGALYAPLVEASLTEAGYVASTFTFPAGERHKRAETFVAILEHLAAHELTRHDVVVALGGGVTGDVAGFAAASYMRGCNLVQMPTSLLAMVDSSVGGKTAIDLEGGKNLAGAFWQPRLVLADVGCLGTLDEAQFADGCGEVVKHAVIADPALFDALERDPLTLSRCMRDLGYASAVVARNVEIKRDVVAMDEREAGPRKLLNLGHSIGHAIEACAHYTRGHGSCVAAGMVAITRAAALEGACAPALPARLDAVLRAHGLDTSCPFTPDELFACALHDKKRTGDTIDLVIPRAIGACAIETVSLDAFRVLIARGLEDTEVTPC